MPAFEKNSICERASTGAMFESTLLAEKMAQDSPIQTASNMTPQDGSRLTNYQAQPLGHPGHSVSVG